MPAPNAAPNAGPDPAPVPASPPAAPGAPAQAQRTAKGIHAYARNARLAIWLQLLVAAFAFAATVVFGLRIQQATQQLQDVETKLSQVGQALDASSARLLAADDATRAVLEAAAALATRESDRYAAAIASLAGVRSGLALASANLEAQKDQAAVAQLQDVRFSVTGTLARVLFSRPGRQPADLDQAIALATENLREPRLQPEQRFAGTIELATFHCARGDAERVRALLDAQFLATFPQAGANGVLPEACRAMAQVAPPAVAGFDAATADPAYRIRTVYVQMGSGADLAGAAQLALALCEAGYDVPAIERVEAGKIRAGGELRYYYGEQASEAAWLAARVAEGGQSEPAVRRLTGFPNLDRHTAELWLPPIKPRATSAAQADVLRHFKGCLSQNRPAGAIDRLVGQLTSDNKQDRLSAGQTLANQLRGTGQTDVIAALIDQLEGQKLDHLSAAGRLNILYLLNVAPDWSSRPEKARLTAALGQIRARAVAQGIGIGAQTQDCLSQLGRKLAGQPASDRCGGL